MKLSKVSIKHCPEIAELYITPRNLGFGVIHNPMAFYAIKAMVR